MILHFAVLVRVGSRAWQVDCDAQIETTLHRLGFLADEGLPNRVEDFHVIPSTAKFPLSATRLGQKETADKCPHAFRGMVADRSSQQAKTRPDLHTRATILQVETTPARRLARTS